jgi:mannose-6-phosphate isomerase-like protein (cupin superfamily)
MSEAEYIKKDWGGIDRHVQANGVIVDELYIESGKSCSRHRHAATVNYFIVIDGTLMLTTYDDAGIVIAEQTLLCGDSMEVKPREWHRFEAVGDVHAIEVMHSHPDGDIERA